jgi:beta-glucanase (GH16 family)
MYQDLTDLTFMNRKHCSIWILINILFFQFSNAQPPGASTNWKLVFEDNFDGTKLDQSKWGYNYPWGNTHNHRAYMTDSMVTVKDGILSIKAINKRHPNAPAGTDKYPSFGYLSFDYTSGAIHSKGKFETTYGYIEGRFKVPSTSGTWPAFWTLNADGAWPPEIDILEIPDDRKVHHYYYHYGPDWQNEKSFGSTHTGPDKSQGFHTYGVEWGPTYLKFYFNGQLLNSYTNRSEAAQGKNMYMLINLAIDGWAPTPPANAQWPAIYQCDWVRVWKVNETANFDFETGSLSPWGPWNNATITTDCKRSGNYGVKLSGNPVSIERTVILEPNTRYVFGGHGKVNTSGETAMFGVKNYGGNQITKNVRSTFFTKDSVIFTTGSSNTSAIVFWYKQSGNGSACGDDFFLYKLNNLPPLITITGPGNNPIINAPGSFIINANASDSDGSITKVEFYDGSTLLGTDATAPYSFSLTNVSAGNHIITAKAFDNAGASTVSPPLQINVNALPIISIVEPVNNTVFNAPASINIKAAANDPDGSIASVEFYNGAQLIGITSQAPYSFIWTESNDGQYDIFAVAKDNLGQTSKSNTISVSVSTVSSINTSYYNQLIIYPNPFFSDFKIIMEKPEKILSVRLYNSEGKEIYNTKNIQANELTIGSELLPGVYYINLVTESHCFTRSIFKK